jgi:hypothetical protein
MKELLKDDTKSGELEKNEKKCSKLKPKEIALLKIEKGNCRFGSPGSIAAFF